MASPNHSFSSPRFVDSWTVNPVPQNPGSPPQKGFHVLHQTHTWPREKTTPSLKSVTSRAPNQPQYELSHHPLLLNVNIIHPLFAVFELPDELILSILSHISPEPRLTGHYARFREQYCMEINDDHQERVRFLRPLSMTCRAMRLRLLSWMWDLVEPSRVCWYDLQKGLRWNLAAIGNALQADTLLAASVRYFSALLCPCAGADSCPKVHDSAFSVEWRDYVRQMPKVPPKSPHARDGVGS